MDGHKLLARMKRLGEVSSMKDVKPLTSAVFPGSHCPLMGAALAVRGIADAAMLVIGTDECAYYTKNLTLRSEDFGGVTGRCLSMILKDRDVTFGCAPKVEAAVKELMEEYKPEALFLVTTCLVEMIGDDIDAVAEAMTDVYDIPVMTVHTEHFKCEDHIPGIERTLTACFEVMDDAPQEDVINILGQRTGDFQATELAGVLERAGVRVGLQLPCGCTVADIRKAAAARVNVVTNSIALPLAKRMQRRFGIPYVFFDKFCHPDRILESYKILFEALEAELPAEVMTMHRSAVAETESAADRLHGVSYIYGNTPLTPFEFNRFMIELGMVPELIQIARMADEDAADIAGILRMTNPLVTKSANIAPLQYVYDVLKPMLYLGHEFAARLRQKGIILVASDGVGSKLGFEVTHGVLKNLVKAADEARLLRSEEAAS